jgi:type III secretion protein Q
MAPDADIPFVRPLSPPGPRGDAGRTASHNGNDIAHTRQRRCDGSVRRRPARAQSAYGCCYNHGAIERLALDDVMLSDLECQPDNAAIAVIVEHLVIPVELSPAGIVITARPLRGRDSSWEWSMGNPTEFSGPTGLHDSDLDDLPVRLVFELGRVELSLGELQRLAPGALVPLARPLDEPLDIMANGRRLGRGALVQIGESLGVRIVSLVGNE